MSRVGSHPSRTSGDSALPAYPFITRQFADEGADVLIEITNDAYQGETAVMRQHLSNAVFRAVETGRSDDRFVAISRGLHEGEMIAVRGVADLQTAYASVR